MRLSAFFKSLKPQSILIILLFSMKQLLLTVVNLIFTSCERATVGDSLHVGQNFWCLIMASTKLM